MMKCKDCGDTHICVKYPTSDGNCALRKLPTYQELKDQVARLLEFTKEQEWSSHGGSRCPVCGAWDSDGHTERCKLLALIRECEGGE